MKINRLHLFFFSLVLFSTSITSCLKDQCDGTSTFIQWNPVYKTLDEIRTDIQVERPRSLENPGKLYFYNGYVLVNERREGVHVIDNSDPANPTNVAFIAIEGNVDMAVKNGYLYVDNYIDLLTIDIRNPEQPQLIKRVEDVFPHQGIHPEFGLLVHFEQQEATVEINCSDPRFGRGGRFIDDGIIFTNIDVAVAESGPVLADASSGAGADAVGIGGSFARFTISKDHLYTVDENSLRVFDISDVTCPNFQNTTHIGWGIETIFPLKDNLFIGANNGMFIYDISTPTRPEQLSMFQHARACDPVFVQDNTAFVTLRSGNACEGFVNQLDVLDVSELEAPRLLHTYPMDNPHGLSVKGNTLYLCEGESGFKIFDITTLSEIDEHLIHHKKDFQAYDVIAYPNEEIVMVIGNDGFYQFDTSDKENLKELSVIPVN